MRKHLLTRSHALIWRLCPSNRVWRIGRRDPAKRAVYSTSLREIAARKDAAARRLIHDPGGAVAMTTALVLTALVGIAGLAVDVGDWETHKDKMQGVADDAVYSAAIADHAGGTPSLEAKAIAASMGFVDQQDGVTVTVNNPPAQGKYAGNANGWEVIVSKPQSLWLSRLFLSSQPQASARAVAHAQASASPYCILGLDPSASPSVSVQGGATVNLSGCSMQVDSSSSTALNVWGSSQLTADTVSVTGNYALGSSSTLTTTDPIDAPGAEVIPDPYANVEIPSYSGCDHNHQIVNSTMTLNPGVYCNGLTINGTGIVTLNPGIYIIDRGSLSIMGGAVVNTNTSSTPYGVTFILPSSTGSNYATVTINGGSTVTLTAPTVGPTAGLVFYEDRNAPSSATATLNGGTGQSFTGALYFPSTTLTYSGDSGASACTQIIADKIVYTGSTTIESDCVGTGVTTITSYTTSLSE